ncbi:hypothetical protein BT69DRAFT_1332876 [Atractiella rhizophila]|nr:hypothetical protein BT69DRAFT_1332876 [Atractiella rhizophila]
MSLFLLFIASNISFGLWSGIFSQEASEQQPSIPCADVQEPDSRATALFKDDRQQNFISHSTSIQTPTNTSEVSTSVPFAADSVIVDPPLSDDHRPPSFDPFDSVPNYRALVTQDDPPQRRTQTAPSFAHAENIFDDPINLPGPDPAIDYDSSVVLQLEHRLDGHAQYPVTPSPSHFLSHYWNTSSGRQPPSVDQDSPPFSTTSSILVLPEELMDLIFWNLLEPDSSNSSWDYWRSQFQKYGSVCRDWRRLLKALSPEPPAAHEKLNYLKQCPVFQRRWSAFQYRHRDMDAVAFHTLVSALKTYQTVSLLSLVYPMVEEERWMLIEFVHLKTIKQLELQGWDDQIDAVAHTSSSFRDRGQARPHTNEPEGTLR